MTCDNSHRRVGVEVTRLHLIRSATTTQRRKARGMVVKGMDTELNKWPNTPYKFPASIGIGIQSSVFIPLPSIPLTSHPASSHGVASESSPLRQMWVWHGKGIKLRRSDRPARHHAILPPRSRERKFAQFSPMVTANRKECSRRHTKADSGHPVSVIHSVNCGMWRRVPN
jgi:hypothetical protein